MVYDWSGSKEQECYQLYVEERKSLDEVMDIMKRKYDFQPSKRAYQVQFKRWNFPSKQRPAHKDAALVERTRQLWEANTTQRDILRTLHEEGFMVSDRELMRMRSRNGWLLRAPTGMKAKAPAVLDLDEEEREGEGSVEREIQNLMMNENANKGNTGVAQASATLAESVRKPPAFITPEIQLRKQQRARQLQDESAERYRTKKRRRRTRGWAGLPADPPAPPRFPSETTLDESKAYLHLSNETYRVVRDRFMSICQEEGFSRKTEAGVDRWNAAIAKLVDGSPHLTNQMHGPNDGVPKESKQLALDVVCMDVTKRMRTMGKRMSLAEAKNQLKLNPEQAREIRQNFYDILVNDHFTSKHEAGKSHWESLQQQWILNFPILQQLVLPSEDESKHQNRRAADIICRDVMKRLRDDQTRLHPELKKQLNVGPGPGPARPKVSKSARTKGSTAVPSAPTEDMTDSQSLAASLQAELQIDPSLLAAASHPSLAFDQLRQYAASAEQQQDSAMPATTSVPDPVHQLPALIRVSQSSSASSGSKMWIVLLSIRTLEELRQLVTQEHPGVSIVTVEGVTSNNDGSETLRTIDDNDKLQAYLSQTSQGKVQFQVTLVAYQA